ncbi:MAG TPA: DNA polymerase Y family protein [Blastocatellia bacterium]|nr:DNA polymerase Y family protein [Blastocatellia bacterium]
MFACVYSPNLENYAALVNCAYAFSPLVEETAENTVVLDIEGCELLFGSPREIAKEIARQAAKLGLKANVATAQNPDAAIHAARYFSGVTVIAPGKEAKRLGDLPLEALDATLARVEAGDAAEILETLGLWGIHSFREFAALPEAGVSERLGPEGMRLQKLARGESERPLLLSKPAPGFEKSIELDDPIELLEPLSFILARLLNQLCANLQAHGLAVDELRLRLKLEDKTEHQRAIRLPFPMRDSRVFLKLLLLDIESHPPQLAIVAVSIACEPAKPRSIQNGLFQPLAPEPEKLELTLARLARLVGESNVGSPELVDTHRPGAFRIKRFIVKRESGRKTPRGRRGEREKGRRGEGETGRQGEWATGASLLPFAPSPPSPLLPISPSLLGFRVFRPPLRAEVEAPNGWPTRIKAQARAGRSIRGKVLRLAGPWRTSGDWWAEDGWARDEWDVAVGSEASQEKGTLFRIYRDLRSDGWFVEGVYD